MGFCTRTSCARAAPCVSSLLLRAPTLGRCCLTSSPEMQLPTIVPLSPLLLLHLLPQPTLTRWTSPLKAGSSAWCVQSPSSSSSCSSCASSREVVVENTQVRLTPHWFWPRDPRALVDLALAASASGSRHQLCSQTFFKQPTKTWEWSRDLRCSVTQFRIWNISHVHIFAASLIHRWKLRGCFGRMYRWVWQFGTNSHLSTKNRHQSVRWPRASLNGWNRIDNIKTNKMIKKNPNPDSSKLPGALPSFTNQCTCRWTVLC